LFSPQIADAMADDMIEGGIPDDKLSCGISCALLFRTLVLRSPRCSRMTPQPTAQ